MTVSRRETAALKRVKSGREFHYRWVWQLRSSPDALWSYVADTQRFNRDANVPSITIQDKNQQIVNNRRKLKMYRFKLFGLKLIPIEWIENPFEWIKPQRFGVVREYTSGPMRFMRTLTELRLKPEGGTEATYEVWATPRNLIGTLGILVQIGIMSANDFRRVFKRYDEMAQKQQTFDATLTRPHLEPGARSRINIVRDTLGKRGVDIKLVDRLIDLVERGDEITLARIRPYALADAWGVPRRAVLEVCLHATRAGLLDIRWELLCPLCRGAKASVLNMSDLEERVHCDVCNIDYEVNFDQSVELVFSPNKSVRPIEHVEYCIGGPQVTPHIALQKVLRAGERQTFTAPQEYGRHRVRTMSLRGGQLFLVDKVGKNDAAFTATANGWSDEELTIQANAPITLENRTNVDQLFIVERLSWSDQGATAAEVTAMQLFRDLFSQEALRASAQFSVGSLTMMFTDLRDSTALYREVGDAPAFGMVLSHFDVLRDTINAENGAIVKTNGDAAMAVFRRPINAIRAAVAAQRALASQKPVAGRKPLALKVGLHTGSCIAVNLNDRLDYFGTTVNIAARLETLSSGDDIVLSESVYTDPEVVAFFTHDESLGITPFEATLKGFEGSVFELWRLSTSQSTVITLE